MTGKLEFVEYAHKGSFYPACSEHGAMNMVAPTGLWRCLECHIGYDEKTKTFLATSKDSALKKAV